MLYSALQWLTSVTIRFTTHESLRDKGLAVVVIHCKNSWFSLSNMVEEDRGVWTPYPQVLNPPAPAQFFPPNPHPLFFLIFFRVPPPKIQIFCPPPPPAHLTHAHSHPTPPPPRPYPLPPPPSPPVLPHNMMIKKVSWYRETLQVMYPILNPSGAETERFLDNWVKTVALNALAPCIPGSSATKVHKRTLQYRR